MLIQTPPLEEICPICRGTGKGAEWALMNLPNTVGSSCGECAGTGYRLTLFGLDVITCLARHREHLRKLILE